MAQKKTKSRKTGKARSKGKDSILDPQILQKAAANALLSLTPGAISSMCDGLDPDVSFGLVYAAANQTVQQFEGISPTGGIRPPTRMRVAVEYDPTLKKAETEYNFTQSKFTIYTPEDLNESITAGERKMTREEMLRNSLSESLPSAQLKLFHTQGRLFSNGNEEAYRDRFLPEQFKGTKGKRSRTKARSRGKK